MSTYRLYQDARDTAWRALLRLREKRLPADVFSLADDIGMEIHPFPEAGSFGRLSALVAGEDGGAVCVSFRIRGKWHIFLREDGLTDDQKRFAVAHELGHLLLGHETETVSPGVRRFASRENQGDLMDDPRDLSDYAADIFAIRLLAPACLLHELGIDTPGRIAALCGLPPRACALRAERMELLNERNAFYKHALERQVRDCFLPFIREKRAGGVPLSPPELPARPVRLVQPLPRREAYGPSPENKPPKPDKTVPEGKKSDGAAAPEKRGVKKPVWYLLFAAALIAGLLAFFLFRK